MDNNSKIRKIIKTTLNEWLNEQQNIKSSDEIIDTIAYFLNIWLPLLKLDTILPLK